MLKRILSILCIFIVIIGFLIYPLTLNERTTHLSQFSGDNDGIDNDGDGEVDEADEAHYDDISIFRNEIADDEDYTVKSLLSSPSSIRGMMDPQQSLYVVSGVEKRYSRSEIDAIADFVTDGGTAIVADDFGYANDLASRFDVAFFNGLYVDRQFVRNTNFTTLSAKLSVDSDHDGYLDEDNDHDGLIDEDPVNGIDDDGDWDMVEDDLNGDGQPNPDEPHVDEDPLDDDDDDDGHPYNNDGIDNDGDGRIDEGGEGVNEELLDGIDNDGDGLIDEDIMPFDIVLNRPTGLYIPTGGDDAPPKSRVIARGSENSFVDMNGDGVITLPEVGERASNDLADELGPINVIVEITVCPECGEGISPAARRCDECDVTIDKETRQEMGRIIFIADGSIFTNNLIQIDELDSRGQLTPDEDGDGRPDGDGERDYDNLEFGVALVHYLLPEGGVVVIDESRHAQDRFVTPIASSMWFVALLTSNWIWFAFLIAGVGVGIFIFYSFIRGKESWIHHFNINRPKHRASMPQTPSLQTVRMRRAMLEKARLSRGLSPEEFNTLKQDEVSSIIDDPVLSEFVSNENKMYDTSGLQNLYNRIKSWS